MIDKIKDVMQIQIKAYITATENQAEEYKKAVLDLVAALEPDIESNLTEAMKGNGIAVTNLELLGGQIAAKVAEVGLDAVDDQGIAISNIVVSILHTAIKLLL